MVSTFYYLENPLDIVMLENTDCTWNADYQNLHGIKPNNSYPMHSFNIAIMDSYG